MLIAQITDMHMKAERRLAYGRVDTAGLLEATVDHVNRFAPAIEAVIVTGDLTDRGSTEEFRLARSILDRLAMPYYVVPGNHDCRDTLLAAFRDHPYLDDCLRFVQFSVENHPLRLVGLDTTVPGEPHGELCDERLTWLDASLAAAPDRPTMLFMHHPPFKTGIRHMDVQNLVNADRLAVVLARHSQVRHVACGHVHRASETVIAGIGVSIAPNGAHAVTLNLDPNGPPTFTMEPPAIRIFWCEEDGGVVSHVTYVGRFDGPHPFFGEDGQLLD